MAKIRITGVKKAIGEYKDWISCNYGYTANIMLNKETGKVWVDCFTSCNSWIEYHSAGIICLSDFISQRTNKPLTMQLLKEYAEIAIA